MGLSSEMKNLSEKILASFKQRIKENEDLVNDVQQTLDGFRKDHQEMASILNANAKALRNDLATGEKERLSNFSGLMAGIHVTIGSIQQEVMAIQASTVNMINDFNVERGVMAGDLDKFFAEGKADRAKNEKTRMEDFDSLMKNINEDIKSINEEVLAIFKETNEMLDKFEKEHLEMSTELKADLSKNLADRVEYTRTMLNGFQKRLSEISKENQKMAQQLRKDLDKGENVRLSDYKGLMKDIHVAINGIRTDVMDIKKTTSGLIGYYAKDRGEGVAEWAKMQDAIAKLRETGIVAPAKAEVKKKIKTESPVEVAKQAPAVIIEAPVEVAAETPAEVVVEIPVIVEPEPVAPMTLEEKVLDYINKHPNGVKVSEMEGPLGETRMKIGFIGKALLDEGKVQKVENVYFPLK
jgi:DNA repair exonuclease SbcCD ATPase subunit